MSDDRSSRLRERRNKSRGRAANASEDEPSKLDETSNPSETDETDELSEQSVKEEQVGTYMYLPQSQKREIERAYGLLKADYEYEFGEDFEKNRHFFPLLIQHGLDGLDELDASDIKELLSEV